MNTFVRLKTHQLNVLSYLWSQNPQMHNFSLLETGHQGHIHTLQTFPEGFDCQSCQLKEVGQENVGAVNTIFYCKAF